MTEHSHSESLLVKFLDNFLQEKNIRWVLAAGMLILLGSTLMMVMPHWDAFSPLWKFLTIVGYTGAIWAGGWSSYHRFALRKTGTSLLSLAVLMIPISFMAWHWTWAAAGSFPGHAIALGLLTVHLVLAAVLSRLTFRHFLQGDQPTFLASYLLLSLAGAVAPGLRDAGEVASWLASGVLWGVFSIGVVKVNRHVFWLTEEHGRPRICGFFPILLLGAQFLSIFAINFARSLTIEWIGLGSVLVAIPVLLTADAVAQVFQQRTGNLVRPIPWPIMLPLTFGLVLCAAGVVLSGTAIHVRTPFALVPTSALAAGMMLVVARRTNRAAFVWAMLVGIVVAYNFSPVFFQNAARTIVAQSAQVVKEARLPLPFYGLTYLPLIATMTGVATLARRHGNMLYARPLQQFCFGVSCLMLAACLGHLKAIFPVAAVMTVAFAAQAVLFQDRRISLAAIIAYLVAAAGVVPFVAAIYASVVTLPMYFIVPIGATVMLLAASPWIDRSIAKIPMGRAGQIPDVWHRLRRDRSTTLLDFQPSQTVLPGSAEPMWTSMCRFGSLCGTIVVAVTWVFRFADVRTDTSLEVSLMIAAVLLLHSLVWVRPAVTWFTYGFGVAEATRFAIKWGMSFDAFTFFAVSTLFVQWMLTYVFRRVGNLRISRAWSAVNQTSAVSGLLGGAVLLAVPAVIVFTIFRDEPNSKDLLILIRNGLLTLWCFDAVRRLCDQMRTSTSKWLMTFAPLSISTLTGIGCVCVLGVISCAMTSFGGSELSRWIGTSWTLVAIAAIPAIGQLRRRLVADSPSELAVRDARGLLAVIGPTEVIMYVVFWTFMMVHLVSFSLPTRIAGYLSIAGMFAATMFPPRARQRQATMVIANWSLVVAAAHWFAPADNLVELLWSESSVVMSGVAAAASATLLLWIGPNRLIQNVANPLAVLHRHSLRVACAGALLFTLDDRHSGVLTIVLALSAFAALVVGELWAACRSQQSHRVWVAQYLGALAFGYLAWFEVIQFEHGGWLFAVLVAGLTLHLGAVLAARHPVTKVLAGPLSVTGMWMPMATVALGVFRHFAYADAVVWRGTSSFAILLAGAFYFWQAIERQSKHFAILSAVVLNTALALLWRELKLNDPQFYMVPIGISVLALVQVLKREIPAVWHDPLRYAGALTILVSPTFHIVSGSWLHLFTLMIASTSILLVSIGLRVRPLMYAGAAFLVADLIGMVVCGGIDHPSVLWLAGIGFGAAIVTLGAVCEHNREKLLQRMRAISAQLKQWE